MSEPNELDRLRADLEVIDRYNTYSIIENARCDIIDRIAKLEAEADPWAEARGWISSWQGQGDYPVVVDYVRHLEADNAEQAARIAEQNGYLEEWDKVAWKILPSYDLPPEPSHVERRAEELKTRIAELEANAKTDVNTIAGLRLMIEDYQARPGADILWSVVSCVDGHVIDVAASREEAESLLIEINKRNAGNTAPGIWQKVKPATPKDVVKAFRGHRDLENRYRVDRDEAWGKIKSLEARPVPPLDPKRVIATACKVFAKEHLQAAGYIMQLFGAGDAGIYPLAGDDT